MSRVLAAWLAVVAVTLAACSTSARPPAQAPAAPAGPGGGAAPAASAGAPAPEVSAPERITILKPSQGGNSAALWFAEDEGLFTKNGLEVEVRYIAGSPVVMQAMVAGEGQFASVGTTAAISAALRGLDAILVATQQPQLVFTLWTNGIERVADLPGKRIATGRANTDPDFALRLLLEQQGLRYNEDVLAVGIDAGDAARIAAVQTGSADGLVIGAGYTGRLRALGYTPLLDTVAQRIPYEAATLVTTRPYESSKPHVVRAFVRTYVEAIAGAKQDRARMIEIYKSHARLDGDDIANEWYETYVQQVFPMVPYVSETGVQTVLDMLARTDPLAPVGMRPDQYIENRYVRELDESGFIRQLYAR